MHNQRLGAVSCKITTGCTNGAYLYSLQGFAQNSASSLGIISSNYTKYFLAKNFGKVWLVLSPVA